MKYILKKSLIIMMEVMMVLSLFGCALKGENAKGIFAKANESNLICYSYSYHNSFNPTVRTMTLQKKDDAVIYSFTDDKNPDYKEMSMEVSAELLVRIKEIYTAHKAWRFDGYSKTNVKVLDGDGFSMNMIFADGESYRVSGNNCAPDNFYEFANEVNALFETFNEQLREKAKNERIEKGVQGEVTGFLFDIVQHGSFGNENYSVYGYKIDETTSRISVSIKSADASRFGAMEINFSRDVKSDNLHYEKIEEMVKECGMEQWIDFIGTSPDTVNNEWFQITLDFEEGNISARGSGHPDNYERFRELLDIYLKLLVEETE